MIKLTNANPALGHVWVNPRLITDLGYWHYKRGRDGESDPLSVTLVRFGGNRTVEVVEPLDVVATMVTKYLEKEKQWASTLRS